MKKTLQILTFALILVSLFTGTALAQDNVPTDDEVNAIAQQLYCPVCENTPLDVCPTEACRQWRELIRLQLSQGMTDAEIKQYFVDNYGARVLNEPPREGLNWLVYLVPPAIILAGAFFLFRALRAMKKPVAAAQIEGPNNESSAADYVARLEEEIKKRN